jgi:hypothetical protein
LEFILSATSAGPLCSGHRRKVDRLRIGDGSQNGLFWCHQPLFRPVLVGESERGSLAQRRRFHDRWEWAAQGVRYHFFLAWCVSDIRCEFVDEGELSLLAGAPRLRGAEQGCDEWLVVGE